MWTPEAGVYLLERHVERLIASAEFFGRSVDQDELTQLLGSLTGSEPLRVRLLLMSEVCCGWSKAVAGVE